MNDDFLAFFIKHLHVLASSYESQCGYLADIDGDCIDEIALDFHDYWMPIEDDVKSCPEMKDFYQSILEIDSIFSDMSDNKRLWTRSSLENDPEWKRIRQLAQKSCGFLFPKKIE